MPDQLIELNVNEQAFIDSRLIEIDGTENKAKWAQMPCWPFLWQWPKAAAIESGLPLFRYLGGVNGTVLPIPLMNILNGGHMLIIKLISRNS
jgi:enolase